MIILDPIATDLDVTSASKNDEGLYQIFPIIIAAKMLIVCTTESPNSPSSPTWALGDLLQSLEEPDRSPLFLVSKTNELASLLQRYPNLKKELVLSVFGRRYVNCVFSIQLYAANI